MIDLHLKVIGYASHRLHFYFFLFISLFFIIYYLFYYFIFSIIFYYFTWNPRRLAVAQVSAEFLVLNILLIFLEIGLTEITLRVI